VSKLWTVLPTQARHICLLPAIGAAIAAATVFSASPPAGAAGTSVVITAQAGEDVGVGVDDVGHITGPSATVPYTVRWQTRSGNRVIVVTPRL